MKASGVDSAPLLSLDDKPANDQVAEDDAEPKSSGKSPPESSILNRIRSDTGSPRVSSPRMSGPVDSVPKVSFILGECTAPIL